MRVEYASRIENSRVFQGVVVDLSYFVPQNIGDDVNAAAQWIAAKWPHYNADQIASIQSIYNANTFGSVQNAADSL